MPGGRGRWRGGRVRRGTWFLEPVLLLLLHHGPAHGYTLVEQLEAFGVRDLHPSAAYRALRDMDEEGWLTSSWEVDASQGPPRRIYHLTPLGEQVLETCMQDLEQIHDDIGGLMRTYRRHLKEEDSAHH